MQTIIQGGAKTLNVRLLQKINGVVGDPVDFTGVTQISTCFLKSDGTELMLSLTGLAIAIVGSPLLGRLSIALTSAQTALLAAIENGTLELTITYGILDPIKVRILGAYEVVETEC